MRVAKQSLERLAVERPKASQGPQSMEPAQGVSRFRDPLPQGRHQRRRRRYTVLFDEEPLCRQAPPPVRMTERFDQVIGPRPVEAREVRRPGRQTVRRDDPVDASTVVPLVEVERGLHLVGNPLRVLDHAPLHVQHVEGAVRPHAQVDRPEQWIGRGQKLDAGSAPGRFGCRAVRVDHRAVHHVRRRIGHEDGKAQVRQSGAVEGAAPVRRHGAGGGKPARLFRVVGAGLPHADRKQLGGTAVRVGSQAQAGVLPRGRQAGEVAARNHELAQVIQVVGAEGAAPDAERHPEPARAAAGPLEAARTRFTPRVISEVDPEVILAEFDGVVRRIRPERTAAVASVGPVDPVVQAVAEGVHIVLRVALGKAAQQHLPAVRPAVSVRVLEVDDVGRRRHHETLPPRQDRVRHAKVGREQTPPVPSPVAVAIR